MPGYWNNQYDILTRAGIQLPANELTICAWVRRLGSQNSYSDIITQNDSYALQLSQFVYQHRFIVRTGLSSWASLTDPATSSNGNWYFVVGSYKYPGSAYGNNMRLFVDGGLVASQSQSSSIYYPAPIGPFTVGHYASTRWWPGEIAGCMLFTEQLTDEQIHELYMRPDGPNIRARSSCILDMPIFQEGSFQNIGTQQDHSNSNNDMTIGGAGTIQNQYRHPFKKIGSIF